jgi:hypothetical protein
VVVLSVFPTSYKIECGIGHNNYSICNISSSILCFLVDNSASAKLNSNIKPTKIPRFRVYPEVKSSTQLQARGHFTLILGYGIARPYVTITLKCRTTVISTVHLL